MFKGKPLRVLGAMSGTSLDGVDVAELVTDGVTIMQFGDTAYQVYTDTQRATLASAFGKWQSDDTSAAAEVVETVHAQAFSGFSPAELIGFHGQTVAHDPAGNGTHQIGDGQLIAELTATPVVWDFRSADVQFGGQGAPLAPFFHFALAKWLDASEPLAFLNLGGVGNLTWVDPTKSKPEDKGALQAFDTGPANAPINDLMRARCNADHDSNGALAASGIVDDSIVDAVMSRRYFAKLPPKSLDRNEFADMAVMVSALSDADAVATLTAVAAVAASTALSLCPSQPSRLLVCGGGRHNSTLMAMLRASAPCAVAPVEDVGLNGDMLEAQAFAYLAARVVRGLPTSCPSTTGVPAAVSGGTLSKPSLLSKNMAG